MLRRALCSQRLMHMYASVSRARGLSHSAVLFEQHRRSAERQEDEQLEEEEFNLIRERMEEEQEYLPLWRTMGNKFPNLQLELRRIAYVLTEREQFMVLAKKGATLCGAPADPLSLYQRIVSGAEATRAAVASAAASHSIKDAEAVSVLVQRYGSWTGTSSLPMRLACLLPISAAKDRNPTSQPPKMETALTTLTEDLDYLRRVRRLHALNYYFRMTLTPKRNAWHAVYYIIWNCYVASMNACGSVVYGALYGAAHYTSPAEVLTPGVRGGEAVSELNDNDEEENTKKGKTTAAASPRRHGHVNATAATMLWGGAIGLLKGVHMSLYFLVGGFVVSPVIHSTAAVYNSFWGVVNFYRGNLFFDSLSGRWTYSALRYQNRSLGINNNNNNNSDQPYHYIRRKHQREKRLLRAIGRVEFFRKRMTVETKWANRLSALGFSLDQFKATAMKNMRGASSSSSSGDGGGSRSMPNPYEVLNVKRTATAAQIKAQYKRLALLHHPDVSGDSNSKTHHSNNNSNEKFAEISQAYQILSNPEKKAAYDRSGAAGVSSYESQHGSFASRTPEEMIQSIYGGRIFQRRLTGELLRSHWSLQYEGQVSVSVSDLEELQCIRTKQLAFELAEMLDVHAKNRYNTNTNFPNTNTNSNKDNNKRNVSSVMSSMPGSSSSSSSSGKAYLRKGNKPGDAAGKSKLSSDLRESVVEELGQATAGKTAAKAPHDGTESIYKLKPHTNRYNNFTKDFEDRVERFTKRCADACFGRELLYEIGQSYIVNAQRHLGIVPFHAPKRLIYAKVAAGIGKVAAAFKDDKAGPGGQPLSQEELGRRLALEFFDMEFDNITADLHVCLRYVCQLVCTDTSEVGTREPQASASSGSGEEFDPNEVLVKRCYALWYMGEKFMAHGRDWNSISGGGVRDDAELIAYIQQAAHSAASTEEPPAF